jgi:hypothetical protein
MKFLLYLVSAALFATGLGSFAQSTITIGSIPSSVDPAVIYGKPQPPTTSEFVQRTLYPATVLLFSQNDDGGMRMRCTATAFEKTKDGYRFVTAAHCATQDGDQNKKKAKAEVAAFYISSDVEGEKDYIPVAIDGCGSRSRGDDFCIFRAKTPKTFPVVQVGSDATDVSGEPVINIASPLGLGKQAFYGRVSKPHVDRKIIYEDINWSDSILLQLPGTDGGSSGSAIICERQRAICGFLVGAIDKTQIVAIPVSKFKKFRDLSDAGTYKYFSKDGDDGDDE